jgi:hypothetical protein
MNKSHEGAVVLQDSEDLVEPLAWHTELLLQDVLRDVVGWELGALVFL